MAIIKPIMITVCLKTESNYSDLKLKGKKTYYYRYGGLKKEENYYMGRLDGIVKTYSEKGKLLKEEKYTYGTLITTKTYSQAESEEINNVIN